MLQPVRNKFAFLVLAVLGANLLIGCSGGTEAGADVDQQIAELQTQLQELDTQLQAAQTDAMQMADSGQQGAGTGATLVVKPTIFKFPDARVRGAGVVWFFGSGLAPGQWFRITVHLDGERGELTDFAEDALRRANDDGTFALTLPGIRPDRFQAIPLDWGPRGGVWEVRLRDLDTDAVIATAPWVVCGTDRENEWCPAAIESAIVPEPVVEGAGTVFNVARIRIEDDNFQLRVGPNPLWGYEAESRIDSKAGDGWVMTIALGDSILISERLENRGSVDHHLTIADLGIDVVLTPDQRITDGFEIKPDKVGEFVIDDSSHPGEHGKALLIVTE